MIYHLHGEITEIGPSFVVMDVGGVGYELCVSAYTLAECQVGQTRSLFTYLQVKEDGISLYGFATLEEKKMFTLLISVSGVGCKVAQAILSGIDTNSLATAIFSGDTKALVKIKGLGKKTAERLVLELKEKVVVDAASVVVAPVEEETKLTKDMQDAIAILCSLGKSRSESEKLIQAAAKLGAVTATELVNMAFRIN